MRFAPLFLLIATAGPALAEVPRVVTDFGPVQSLVADVMGDLGQPEMLLPPGSDPHDFQLRPSQAQALADADVVFWVGPELMPEMAETFATLAPQARVEALLPANVVTRAFGDEPAEHDHSHDEAHDPDEAHDHGDSGIDPHAWLDPLNGIAWANHIARVLGEADPDNAATYAANAEALAQALTTLDAEIAASLKPVAGKPFVVYHDALGYFTDHYGLTVAGAIELGDATTPSAAQLDQVRGVLASAGAICVFPEAGRDAKYIAALTEGLEVKVGGEQDLEFITMPAGPGQYAVMLRAIAATLTGCLGS